MDQSILHPFDGAFKLIPCSRFNYPGQAWKYRASTQKSSLRRHWSGLCCYAVECFMDLKIESTTDGPTRPHNCQIASQWNIRLPLNNGKILNFTPTRVSTTLHQNLFSTPVIRMIWNEPNLSFLFLKMIPEYKNFDKGQGCVTKWSICPLFHELSVCVHQFEASNPDFNFAFPLMECSAHRGACGKVN